MALQALPQGIWMVPGLQNLRVVGSSAPMDAVGESNAMLGRIWLSSGPGTSKTISTAGGKIHWYSVSTTTWASGSTAVRVGIQDVDTTTGLEDGTYDVYGDMVPGVETISTTGTATATMSSGTKTIAYGDLVAVVIELTARGGTDQVRPTMVGLSSNFPYVTRDTGSGPAKVGALPFCLIEFDDGTWGTFGADTEGYRANQTTFHSGSTPDEYAIVFQVPVECQINAIGGVIGDFDAADGAELLLYSDPLGTPTAQATVTIDPDVQQSAATNAVFQWHELTSAVTLSANTNYAVAIRPTTTGAISLVRCELPSAGARAAHVFGTTAAQYTRTDNTGAFGSADTAMIPCMGIRVSHVHDGAGGSGGGDIGPHYWVMG